ETAPRDAGGEDHGPRAQHLIAVESDGACRRIDPLDVARYQDFGAEPPCLLQRSAGKLVARYAVRKAEIVLDSRRRPCLPAARLALDDQCAQTLGCPVHRRREARGAASYDPRAVFRGAGIRLQADALGTLAGSTALER